MSDFNPSLEAAQSLVSKVQAKADLPHGAEREVEMAKQYVLGETLDAIGKDYDLTRERVRQLINLSGWKTSELRHARKVIADDERRQKTELDRDKVLKWSYANPGVAKQNAAEQLGLPVKVVSKLLGKRSNLHSFHTARERRQNWTDNDLIEILRQFHLATGSTVSMDFEKWSMARGGPSRQTPTIRFGSWSAALEKADIEGSYSVDRERQHSDEDLWAAVIEFFSFDRNNYSYDSFATWLSGSQGMPSAALIRVRLGLSWSELSVTGQMVAGSRIADFDPKWVAEVRNQRDWATLVKIGADPVDVLAEAIASIGSVLTIAAYNTWAQDFDRPKAQTLMKRARLSWVQLVEAAGGRTGTRGARGAVSDQSLLEPLIEYALEHHQIRYLEYSHWARENGRPVGSTLSHRFGSWDRAVSSALLEASKRKLESGLESLPGSDS